MTTDTQQIGTDTNQTDYANNYPHRIHWWHAEREKSVALTPYAAPRINTVMTTPESQKPAVPLSTHYSGTPPSPTPTHPIHLPPLLSPSPHLHSSPPPPAHLEQHCGGISQCAAAVCESQTPVRSPVGHQKRRQSQKDRDQPAEGGTRQGAPVAMSRQLLLCALVDDGRVLGRAGVAHQRCISVERGGGSVRQGTGLCCFSRTKSQLALINQHLGF